MQVKSHRGWCRNLCVSLESLPCPWPHGRQRCLKVPTGGSRSEKGCSVVSSGVITAAVVTSGCAHSLWTHFTQFRGDTAPRSPGNCSINIVCLLFSGWKNPSRGFGSSLLVATGWEAKGKSMLLALLGELRAISDFGVRGRVFCRKSIFAWTGLSVSCTLHCPRAMRALF